MTTENNTEDKTVNVDFQEVKDRTIFTWIGEGFSYAGKAIMWPLKHAWKATKLGTAIALLFLAAYMATPYVGFLQDAQRWVSEIGNSDVVGEIKNIAPASHLEKEITKGGLEITREGNFIVIAPAKSDSVHKGFQKYITDTMKNKKYDAVVYGTIYRDGAGDAIISDWSGAGKTKLADVRAFLHQEGCKLAYGAWNNPRDIYVGAPFTKFIEGELVVDKAEHRRMGALWKSGHTQISFKADNVDGFTRSNGRHVFDHDGRQNGMEYDLDSNQSAIDHMKQKWDEWRKKK